MRTCSRQTAGSGQDARATIGVDVRAIEDGIHALQVGVIPWCGFHALQRMQTSEPPDLSAVNRINAG
jgi:hypothetical protein